MHESGPPDSNMVLGLAHGHWMAAGLAAAVRHGCFDALADGPAAAAAVALRCGLPPEHTEMLLEALVGMGLLESDGNRYANTTTASCYLVRASPDYLGALVETLTFAGGIWSLWNDYDRTIAGSRPRDDSSPFDAEVYRRALVNGIRPLTVRAANLTVTELHLAKRRQLRVLDVGGGSGTFSEVVLSAVPGATAVQVDGPRINAEAASRIATLECGNRFDTVDGRFLDVDFVGETFDLVIYSAVAHLHPADANVAHLARCRDLLAPGGRVIFHDYLSHTGAASEPGRVTNLNWLLIGNGRVWPLSTVIGWFAAAGLTCGPALDTGLWMTLLVGQAA